MTKKNPVINYFLLPLTTWDYLSYHLILDISPKPKGRLNDLNILQGMQAMAETHRMTDRLTMQPANLVKTLVPNVAYLLNNLGRGSGCEQKVSQTKKFFFCGTFLKS